VSILSKAGREKENKRAKRDFVTKREKQDRTGLISLEPRNCS